MDRQARILAEHEWDEERLRSIALRCAKIIHRYATAACGVAHGDLWTRCVDYRRLGSAEQFRVQVLLCLNWSLAVRVGAGGAFHFYARYAAPDGAFNYSPPRSPMDALHRALDRT